MLSRPWLPPVAAVASAAAIVATAAAQIVLPAAVYAPLHLVLELVSVLVATMVAATGWQTLHRIPSLALAAAASAFAGVALLDLGHTLIYEGMPALFGPTGGGRAVAPFLAARLMAALGLLALVAIARERRITPMASSLLLTATLASALGVVGAGFVWPDLRLLFMTPGVGLTPLKIALEMVLVVVYLAVAVALWWQARSSRARAPALLALAATLMGLAELALAVYRTPTDLPNLLGHVLKVGAYLLVYRAVFVPMILEPWLALDRAHAALDAGEERWRMLFAHSVDALLMTTPAGDVVTANPAACQLFGHSEAQLRAGGRALVVDPQDAPRLQVLMAQRARDGHVTGELRFRRADGSVFEAEIASSIYADAGGATMASLLVRDVTDRKRREREALRLAQLEAANAQLERFSYAVAHDLRAPLAAVAGFTDALVHELPRPAPGRVGHFVERIQVNVRRMDAMVEGLLTLSSLSRAQLQPRQLDLSALAREQLAHLRERDPARVLEARVQDGLQVWADPRLVDVLLQNLLHNAWKFCAPRPRTCIAVGATTGPDGETVFHVQDNGVGFDMAQAGRLFGVFQRLHGLAEFEGHGIGLATVKQVVERHGGRIWAEGRLDAGASFHFTLPTVPPAAVAVPMPVAA